MTITVRDTKINLQAIKALEALGYTVRIVIRN